jgi:HEAT repeat protein
MLGKRPPKIEKLERKPDVDGLVRALGYEDPITDRDGQFADLGAPVRREAVEALARIGTAAADDGLLRALGDPEASVRAAAARGLRGRSDSRVTEALTAAAVEWTEPQFASARTEAVEALASLGDPAVARGAAAALLGRTSDLDDGDADVLRRLTEAGGHDAAGTTVDDLVGRLRKGDPSTRARALLVWLAPHSVEPLIRTLDDPVAQVDAAVALGAAHDSRAVERLCSLVLTGETPAARAAAAWALGEIMDQAAVPTLLAAAADEDYRVRREAVASFDRLGNPAIALAMSTLVRPMIENGAKPSLPEIEQGPVAEPEPEPAGATPDPAGATPDPAGSTQDGDGRPTVVDQSPDALERASELLSTRAAPALRRLLNRRAGS